MPWLQSVPKSNWIWTEIRPSIWETQFSWQRKKNTGKLFKHIIDMFTFLWPEQVIWPNLMLMKWRIICSQVQSANWEQHCSVRFCMFSSWLYSSRVMIFSCASLGASVLKCILRKGGRPSLGLCLLWAFLKDMIAKVESLSCTHTCKSC